jgi:hypothetical protein
MREIPAPASQPTRLLKAFTSRPVIPKRMLTPAPDPLRSSRLPPRLPACHAPSKSGAARMRASNKRAAPAKLPQWQFSTPRPANPTASHAPTLPEVPVY